MKMKYSWIIQANKKHPASMREARISMNLTRFSVCVHPRDRHLMGANTKAVLFACLKHCQWFLSKHLLFLIKILFPLHKNDNSPPLPPLNEAENGRLCKPGRHIIHFLLPALLTLAEINVEWSHSLDYILTGQMSPTTSPPISSATEWSEIGENGVGVTHLSSFLLPDKH